MAARWGGDQHTRGLCGPLQLYLSFIKEKGKPPRVFILWTSEQIMALSEKQNKQKQVKVLEFPVFLSASFSFGSRKKVI